MKECQTFEEVKDFFKSWGMFPHKEETEDLNSDVIMLGINRCCFNKMMAEARREHGDELAVFILNETGGQDDSFCVEAPTWIELRDAWNDREPISR